MHLFKLKVLCAKCLFDSYNYCHDGFLKLIFPILHVGSTRNWKILCRCDSCPSFIINVCSKNIWTYLGKSWSLLESENNLKESFNLLERNLSLLIIAVWEMICWPDSTLPSIYYLSVFITTALKNCTFGIKHLNGI